MGVRAVSQGTTPQGRQKLIVGLAQMDTNHLALVPAARFAHQDGGNRITPMTPVNEVLAATIARVVGVRQTQGSSTALHAPRALTIPRVVAPVMVHWHVLRVRAASTVWVQMSRTTTSEAPAGTALLASSKLGKHTMGSLHMRAASIVSQAGSLRVAGAIRTARPVLVVGSNEMPRRATALNATQGSILQQGTMNVKNVRQADT